MHVLYPYSLNTDRRSQFALESAISSANSFLLSRVNAELLLPEDSFKSAAMIKALSVSLADVSPLNGIVNALQNKQMANGSWDNDVFTTALTLSAFTTFQARQQSQDLPKGSLSGRIVLSGSTEPLDDAQITVTGNISLTVNSDARGVFVFTSLPSGDYTLLIVKNGFLSVSHATTIEVQQATNLGDIPLAIAGEVATLSGTVFDDTTQTPLSNVKVLLQGNDNTYQTVTQDNGFFLLNGITYGPYELTLSAQGYHSVTGQQTLDKKIHYKLSQGLVSSGQVLSDQSGDITGTLVDGDTGLALSGILVKLANIGSVTTNATGGFKFIQLPRGQYQLSIDAPGYVKTDYSFNYPPGSNGQLGRLSLYPQGSSASTTMSVTLSVKEVLSGQAISGASVNIGTQSVTTDAHGQATLNNIATLSFDVNTNKDGYLSNQQNITASGFGTLHLEVLLTPQQDPSASHTQVSGFILDEDAQPISGALVEVLNTPLSSITDSEGHYRIENIDTLSFTLRANADNYTLSEKAVILQAYGAYSLNLSLNAIEGEVFHLNSLTIPEQDNPANARILIQANIHNASDNAKSALIRGQIFDRNGAWVANIDAYTPGTQQVGGEIEFSAEQTMSVTLVWNNKQTEAGQYTVRVSVIEPGTISRALPNGYAYTQRSGVVSIASSSLFAGGLQFEPPLSQAGQQTPVKLNALIRNVGNIPIPAGNYTLTMTAEEGTLLYSQAISMHALAINEVADLSFGQWLPSQAGHLSVSIKHNSVPQAGEIQGIYYVGDIAVGELSVDQSIFPEGTHQTKAHIKLKGVDITQGSSVDPLFEQVRSAITNGAHYVAEHATSWHRQNRCSGCHVQTQSLLGLSASADKADIDKEQLRFLYNTMAGSQHPDGLLYISHGDLVDSQRTLALLGSWSLIQWNDWQQAYRTKYKAMQYLWGKRLSQDNQTWWAHDHSVAWLEVRDEAASAITAQVIGDLLNNTKALSEPPTDYEVGEAMTLDPAKTKPRGVSVHDNQLYIAKQGAIEKINPTTGHSELIYTDVNQKEFLDVLVHNDGSLYALSANEIVRRDAQGHITRFPFPYPSSLRGMVQWHNALYISDHRWNRIWRLNSDDSLDIFAREGLLKHPTDLTVSHEGHLLVGNHDSFEIIAINSQAQQSVYIDGLPFRPLRLMSGTDNQYYMTTDRYYRDYGHTGNGISVIKPDKTLEVLLNHRGYNEQNAVYGLGVVNQTLYFVDGYANEVRPVNTMPLKSDLIPTIIAELPQLAHYFLTRYDSTPQDHLRNAFKLIGLSELAHVIDDQDLLAQINQGVDHLASLLRAAQHPDGGWGHINTQTSDPLSTAWVGIALDYTNPSANDPMVRQTITYLLNQQAGDGSWWGRYFNTRFGPSSLVMAYMPTALERLGGLDIDLDLTMPDHMELFNPTLLPDESVANPDGSTHYHWALPGVTAKGQNIDFDLNIKNLNLYEKRDVATSATLQFGNSFIDNEKITRDIPVPQVSVPSELTLQTSTDKLTYGANENMTITNLATNAGADLSHAKLILLIRTQAQALIETITSSVHVDMINQANETYTLTWNTSTHLAGAYQVFAQIMDEQGRILAQSTADFYLLPTSDEVDKSPTYNTSITTDKPHYTPYDTIKLNARVRNLALNSLQKPALAKITVSGPDGTEIYSQQWVITQMAPQALLDRPDEIVLNDAKAGLYTASITVWDDALTQQLTSDIAGFEVKASQLNHLKGSVTVSARELNKGEAASCTYSLTNQSETQTVTVGIETMVVALDQENVLQLETDTLTLSPGQTQQATRNLDTQPLAVGEYACLLQASIDDETLNLGYAHFAIIEPPIRLAISQSVGQRGRLLILLDALDYHDPLDKTPIAAQDQYLRSLLDSQDWSYHIVYNANDFTRAFYSGQYTAYALLSNHETLEPHVEEVLVEAIYSGEGLLVSGAYNRRNNKLEKAMGISLSGRQQNADAVILPLGSLGVNWPQTQLSPGVCIDIDRCEGNLLAYYRLDSQQNAPQQDKEKVSACLADSDTEAAIVSHTEGLGQTLFIAFDALDEATASGDLGDFNSPYAQLLSFAFMHIHPKDEQGKLSVSLSTANALPILITITNQGIAVQVRLTLDLPASVTLMQANGWTWIEEPGQQGYWQYLLVLPEQATSTTTLYLYSDVPMSPIPLEVATRVDEGSNWTLYDETARVFELFSSTDSLGITDLMAALEDLLALEPNNKNYRQAHQQATHARAQLDKGQVKQALYTLLRVSDALALESDAGHLEAIQARLVLDALILSLTPLIIE